MIIFAASIHTQHINKRNMMRFHEMLRNAGLALAVCTTVLFVGCGDDTTDPDDSSTFFGPSQTVGDGTAKTYVTLNADGNPTEIGIRISETAMNGLPETLSVPSQSFMLAFPNEAEKTVFETLMLDWNPQGHEPPPLFGKPHFDIHFYMTDMATVNSINPSNIDFGTKAANLPEAKYIPQDFMAPPGPPSESTVPFMGLHWTDSTDGLIPGVYNFTEIFIYGSWDGDVIFMEPMITREWLMTKQTVQKNIKLPQAYQKSGYYPTTYSIRFDNDAKEYVITLGGMTMRQAS